MEKSGVEAVAGPDRIHNIHPHGRADKSLSTALRHGPLGAELYHHYGHDCCKLRYRNLQIIGSRDSPYLSLVRQKHVHIAQSLTNSTFPAVLRIIVCVE